VLTTPPVRLFATSHGIDLTTVAPTGKHGQITRADVEGALARATSAPPTVAPVPSAGPTRFAGVELADWESGPLEERIALRGATRAMAEAMVRSKFTAPHAAAWLRVDATKTVELVAALRERSPSPRCDSRPSPSSRWRSVTRPATDPGINAALDESSSDVVVRRSVALGIAAATPRGLLVPNITGADRLSLREMASALAQLVATARAGTTTPQAMLNTTMTITNVGPFGIDGAMAILPGTLVILAVGQISAQPWVVENKVVVRRVVELSLSFDHRIIDGALASAALAHVGVTCAIPLRRCSLAEGYPEAMSALDYIDLERYPVDDLNSSTAQAVIARAREQIAEIGAAELTGFVHPNGVAALVEDAESLAPRAHPSGGVGTAYLELPLADWPRGTPVRRGCPTPCAPLVTTSFPQLAATSDLPGARGVRPSLRPASNRGPLYHYADPCGR
jgi:hypothetical protein